MTSTPPIDPAFIPFLDALAELVAAVVIEEAGRKKEDEQCQTSNA